MAACLLVGESDRVGEAVEFVFDDGAVDRVEDAVDDELVVECAGYVQCGVGDRWCRGVDVTEHAEVIDGLGACEDGTANGAEVAALREPLDSQVRRVSQSASSSASTASTRHCSARNATMRSCSTTSSRPWLSASSS